MIYHLVIAWQQLDNWQQFWVIQLTNLFNNFDILIWMKYYILYIFQ